ncbi:triphosphoribosyl-dephospho-CoA synthase [Formivibrio citricus]|uniref:Probable 2-(5''-triphosphoribosyl)-3'-dephosphocoenzyme-A synthase n=1 Tax=Formivibrio citricus TaxID=83765 RepID=A0A1I5CDZ0_9NEIS|nr:triphosphoribosyl-dephospho-CoA synthase CitG [Formivibrio citricus]SFN85230.1 triphosphoribosyl-dephospho-CoA synthase [Formivibrio citricus]
MDTGIAVPLSVCLGQQFVATERSEEMATRIGALAHEALIREVELTPKPGLVDRRNAGSHRDMDLQTFHASAAAIAEWFPVFFRRGLVDCDVPANRFLPLLRPEGVACENAMFRATDGVNTHKGGIFSMGLLCAAAGRLHGRGEPLGQTALCDEVAQICAALVEQELEGRAEATTAGEYLFRKHGLTGARGEVAAGFATVREQSLPVFERTRERHGCEERALHAALLQLLAFNRDTNVVSRGGMDGLHFVQAEARRLLDDGGIDLPDYLERLASLDDALIVRNLSPGGSADLLAVTWFLADFPA